MHKSAKGNLQSCYICHSFSNKAEMVYVPGEGNVYKFVKWKPVEVIKFHLFVIPFTVLKVLVDYSSCICQNSLKAGMKAPNVAVNIYPS